MTRVRFNAGSFIAGSWGLVAFTSALARHFHRVLSSRGLLIISFAGGFLLAFEGPPREKSKPRGHANESGPLPPAE